MKLPFFFSDPYLTLRIEKVPVHRFISIDRPAKQFFLDQTKGLDGLIPHRIAFLVQANGCVKGHR